MKVKLKMLEEFLKEYISKIYKDFGSVFLQFNKNFLSLNRDKDQEIVLEPGQTLFLCLLYNLSKFSVNTLMKTLPMDLFVF